MGFKVDRGDTMYGAGNFDFSAGTLVLKAKQVLTAWLEQRNDILFPINFFSGRVWNDLDAVLPGTAATDDLGLVDGAVWGTNAATLQTIDQKANGAPTAAYARFQVPVPENWYAGESLSIRVVGGMVTTVSDTTATVDLEVYVPDGDGTVGSDLCATAAQSINAGLLSAGGTTCDFTVTTATISQGQTLDIRLAITIEDGATGTAVIGAVSEISVMADVRG